MTVRLVRAYGGYAAGATYDGPADEEVDLVAKGNAVWDTRGATTGGGPGNTMGVISTYTAAQLNTLAAAGGLTPYATYVASDTGWRYYAPAANVIVLEYAAPDGTLATLVATADGESSPFVKPSGLSRVAVTASGTVNYAAIYVDNSDTGVPYGAFGAPMSGPRWCNVPAGATNMRIRVEGFSGTTMTVTLAGGV